MAIQDILPVTSITLMGVGFFILITGVIWLAVQNTNEDYFKLSDIKDIENKIPYINQDLYTVQNTNYDKVIQCKNEGKTSEEIAKELKMGKGEVNLILGIDQMR